MPIINVSAVRSRRQILPRNERLKEVSRHTIDHLSALQRRHNENALVANGIPCVVYVRLKHGRPCSCAKETSILSEDGLMSDRNIDLLLRGGDVVVKPYASEDDSQEGAQFFEDQLDSIEEEDEEYEDFEENDYETSVFGGESTSCGVCMGSDIAGGYDIFNGKRIVLDTTAEHTTNGIVDRNDSPNSFKLTPGQQLTFPQILFPYSPVKVDLVRVKNNLDNLAPSAYMVEATRGDTWLDLRREDYQQWIFDGRRHDIRVTVKEDSVFTHLEMQCTLTEEPVYINMSRVSEQYDPLILNQASPVQVTLPMGLGSLPPLSVIRDLRSNNHWLVTSVDPLKTAEGKVWAVDSSIRVVQEYEIYNALGLDAKVDAAEASRLVTILDRF